MQEKYNKSDQISIVILVILIIILFSFLCFITYLTIQKKYVNKIDNTIEIFKYKSPTEIKVDTSLKENDIKKIYSNIFENDTISVYTQGYGKNINYLFNLYNEYLTDVSSMLTYDEKCEIALNKMDQLKFTDNLDDYGQGSREFLILDLQEKYDEIFGYNTYLPNNFNNNYGSCLIEDLKYNCNVSSIWSTEGNMKMINIYDSYEQVDKVLYIYQYVGFYNGNSTYFTSDKTGYNPIYDLNVFNFSNNLQEILNLDYKTFFTKYKLTFTLDDNNNYVWNYIEPVITETYDQTS